MPWARESRPLGGSRLSLRRGASGRVGSLPRQDVASALRPAAVDRRGLPASWEMSRIAFGAGPKAAARLAVCSPAATRGVLSTAPDGWWRRQWIGSRALVRCRRVPASGIAGVVVMPDLRGTGLSRLVLAGSLPLPGIASSDRDAVPHQPGPYRRLGCEQIGNLTWTALPTASLAEVRRPIEVALRRGGGRTCPRSRDVIASWRERVPG